MAETTILRHNKKRTGVYQNKELSFDTLLFFFHPPRYKDELDLLPLRKALMSLPEPQNRQELVEAE